MKLRHLALATALGLSFSTAFALSTAQVSVTANVTSEASIDGMPSTMKFGNISPSTLSNNNVVFPTPQNVSIYDNNIATGTQISTTCSKGDASGKGCYICTGASCTAATQVLLTCTYTACGTGGGTFTITPGASDNASTGFAQTIPAANSSPAACQAAQGSFNCTLNKTAQTNTSGLYTGNVNLVVSDGV
jgi:hypothetical protein